MTRHENGIRRWRGAIAAAVILVGVGSDALAAGRFTTSSALRTKTYKSRSADNDVSGTTRAVDENRLDESRSAQGGPSVGTRDIGSDPRTLVRAWDWQESSLGLLSDWQAVSRATARPFVSLDADGGVAAVRTGFSIRF